MKHVARIAVPFIALSLLAGCSIFAPNQGKDAAQQSQAGSLAKPGESAKDYQERTLKEMKEKEQKTEGTSAETVSALEKIQSTGTQKDCNTLKDENAKISCSLFFELNKK